MPSDAFSPQDWAMHTQILLNSYRHWVGGELIPRAEDALVEAHNLFAADIVVVAHGVEADPLLSYGNQAALQLWEMQLHELVGTPSRLTAEPVHRDERARLLERTRQRGYVDDYQGIRISRSGRRFRIHQALVWNLRSDRGDHLGQAATFGVWEFLD